MEYKVIIDAEAKKDLMTIFHYIVDILKAPDAGERLYLKMVESIFSLSDFPYRCKEVEEEPYKSRGIRRIFIGNYIAFFFVAEESKEVHVFRVLYKRREWQSLL